MAKFFYIQDEQLKDIIELRNSEDTKKRVILCQNNKFTDLAMYSKQYRNIVLFTMPTDKLYEDKQFL